MTDQPDDFDDSVEYLTECELCDGDGMMTAALAVSVGADNDRLAARVMELEAAMWKYGVHERGCRKETFDKCNCGFDAVLLFKGPPCTST